MLFGPFCYKLFTKNFPSPYKGTFFAYLVHIFRFFHKDFILVPLLYSKTLFCHLAHFLRNFRKKIIPYHISERFSAIWSVYLKKILQYFYTLYFLPWRCGYSRIAQTKRQRTKTFGLYSNSRAISLARLFFYSFYKTFCLRFSFR